MKGYELLDSGLGKKLERFGSYILERPCAQAVWKPSQSLQTWKQAHLAFSRHPEERWDKRQKIPQDWIIEVEEVLLKIAPTDFGHVGFFPEHARFFSPMCQKVKKESHILNLFAYTGAASLYLAKKEMQVCHLDASKTTVAWAKENAQHNSIDSIRWIIDDALKFLQREQKRGRKYQGILMDPPTYGRGFQGEIFKIEEHLPLLIELCSSLLDMDSPGFFLLTCHTPGYTPLVLQNLLAQNLLFRKKGGKIELGEMQIESSVNLPAGSFIFWSWNG